jgi:hypothetical protein
VRSPTCVRYQTFERYFTIARPCVFLDCLCLYVHKKYLPPRTFLRNFTINSKECKKVVLKYLYFFAVKILATWNCSNLMILMPVTYILDAVLPALGLKCRIYIFCFQLGFYIFNLQAYLNLIFLQWCTESENQ